MSTYAQVAANIADKLVNTDFSSQINAEINDAIAFYASESFYFTETSGTFNTVAGQKSYGSADSVPTNIKQIDLVMVTISSNNFIYPDNVSYDEIQTMDSNSMRGQPNKYAYYTQKFYLYPLPDAVYTVTVSYKKNYTDLSVGSDTNDFTTIPLAKKLIESRVMKIMYAEWLDDINNAKKYQALEDEYLAQLRSETDRLVAPRSITPSF